MLLGAEGFGFKPSGFRVKKRVTLGLSERVIFHVKIMFAASPAE